MSKFDYDLVISGGGLAGCSLACALADSGARIALLEQTSFRQAQQAGYDERSIALAYGSRRIFESIGLWQDISPYAAAIKNIHIFQASTKVFSLSTNLFSLSFILLSSLDQTQRLCGYPLW